MLEIRLHPIRHRCNALHAGARFFKQCGGRLRDWTGTNRRLQVAVEIFVGIELRCVRRKLEQLDLLGVLRHPLGHSLGAMHAKVVDHQEHLALCILDQILQKKNETISIDRPLEEREPHQAVSFGL